MPGFQIPLSSKTDFNFGVGYMHSILTKGSGGSGAFAIRAGFDFHKPWVKTPRGPVEIRDRGLQMTLEGGSTNPWNFGNNPSFVSADGGLVLGYKYNPHLSFGVGYHYGYVKSGTDVTSVRIMEEERVPDRDESNKVSGLMQKIFLRGQYRLSDKRFSPFVSVDLGMRLYKFDDVTEIEDEYEDFAEENMKSSAFFVSPAVGMSLRTTKNSYFEAAVGFDFSGRILGKKEVETTYRQYTEVTSYSRWKASGMFIRLGWTHTFALGSKRFK